MRYEHQLASGSKTVETYPRKYTSMVDTSFFNDALHFSMDVYRFLVEAPWWPILSGIVAAVATVAAITRTIVGLNQLFLKKRSAKAAKAQADDGRLHWFQGDDFAEAMRDYIVPYCTNVDPSDQDDLRNTVGVREDVFRAVERELASEGRQYILVLADSGMGKTTLLLNLVERSQSKRSKVRTSLALVPLGESGALEAIGRIPDQRNTVLLLDAFDEDPRAIEDWPGRMEMIMAAAAPFKAVVMTCRTQFFPSEKKVPRETGIKRVAARRAGTPVIYQWRSVYLQPFDRDQIRNYVRRAIPWWRRARRGKAWRIVADISDLAARPMLTSLIPNLAASEREVHSLWDLYEFMVDTWVQRESSWIDPTALKRLSRTVAVDLVLNRQARKGERISRAELIALADLPNEAVEAWKLTSRSLLNRDADGYYKFAHRSILEFFFIHALIGGDARCLAVKWTDMMCELFLSWGSSAGANHDRALQILQLDLRKTELFPLADRHRPSGRLDASWVRNAFSNREQSGGAAGLPSTWRAAVAHTVDRGATLRAYDIADGLVWQVDVTTAIVDRAERAVFHSDRYALTGLDSVGDEWKVTDLHEMHLLCDILSVQGLLHRVIDARELYWLADSDGVYSALLRVRASGTALVEYPGLELVQSATEPSKDYAADVYRAETKGSAVGSVKAVAILAFQGNAAAKLAADQNTLTTSSWGITRERAIYASGRQRGPTRRR